MLKSLKKTYYTLGVSLTIGMMTSGEALAQGGGGGGGGGGAAGGNNFSTIAQNITTSIQDLPALLSALSYLVGLVLGVLGILKIKDHVEQPTQTPLKEGAIRLMAGGALFAAPLVYEAMSNSVGEVGTKVDVNALNSAGWTGS